MKRSALALGFFLALGPLAVFALGVAITALVEPIIPPTPPDTVVVFQGIAYPNTSVTIKRGEETLVQVPADPAARFEVELTHQTPGTFTYSISAADSQGKTGSASNFTLTLTEGTKVTLTGIFLGPTISADKQILDLGDTVTILGTTAPESTVTVLVSSDVTKTFETTSDRDGLWVRQVLANDIGVGAHNARAKAVTAASEISAFSETVAFTVREKTAPPSVCDGKNRADLNCDGKVNLQDFSILLFYWKQSQPANERADINRDGIVNLTDLSILLFNWTK